MEGAFRATVQSDEHGWPHHPWWAWGLRPTSRRSHCTPSSKRGWKCNQENEDGQGTGDRQHHSRRDLAADEAGVFIYLKLFEEIWYQEQVPEDWRRAVIVPIFKKKDITECDNYRGISLLCHSEKIFASVLLQIIKARTEEMLPEAQAGFRSGRSTIDQLYALRSIADKYLEHETDLYVCYNII